MLHRRLRRQPEVLPDLRSLGRQRREQRAVERSVNEIVHGDAPHASAAAHCIGPLRYFVGAESNQIVTAYQEASEPARKQLLKNCYLEITGEDIEVRIRIMAD